MSCSFLSDFVVRVPTSTAQSWHWYARLETGMPHLPPELVLAIFEHAYYTPHGSPDYIFLANCSLVCTSWSVPAQSLLFRKAIQLRSHTIASFHAAVASSAARGKFMGHVVRSLDISVGLSLNESCMPDSFAQLLQACPNLYELSLSTYGLHEFDQFMLAKLKHSGRGIRALNLLSCGVQSPVLFQLVGIWPHVKFLKIGMEIAAWPWRHPGETPILRQPRHNGPNTTAKRPVARASLYDLALTRIPPKHVLTWLLGSSASSLRILDLREAPDNVSREILGVHAPHLRSLRLLHFSIGSAAFVRQCTHLEEFVVYAIPVVVPLAHALPASIKHLSFRNPAHSHRSTLRPILDAIEALPKLRMVTCDKSSAQLRDFEMLKTRCAERGVEVVISEVPFWVVSPCVGRKHLVIESRRLLFLVSMKTPWSWANFHDGAPSRILH